ncbi:MAG: cell division protein FtsQ/DivIB [Gallionella sp.]
MWNNAPLLNALARILFLCSVAAVLFGTGYYVVHLPHWLPIKQVRLVSTPVHVLPSAVQAIIQKKVRGNFLTVNIDELRRALAQLTWVRNVGIRREFPNTLALKLEEHQPLARWNDRALINLQGEVFAAQTTQKLPRLMGPQGEAAEVAQHYKKFNQQLSVLSLQISKLVLSPRHAWQLYLSNRMVVELGGKAMQQRLSRFVVVYPYIFGVAPQDKLPAMLAHIKFVDMRYRHGLAVRLLSDQRKAKG